MDHSCQVVVPKKVMWTMLNAHISPSHWAKRARAIWQRCSSHRLLPNIIINDGTHPPLEIRPWTLSTSHSRSLAFLSVHILGRPTISIHTPSSPILPPSHFVFQAPCSVPCYVFHSNMRLVLRLFSCHPFLSGEGKLRH